MLKVWDCWRPSRSSREQHESSRTKINNGGHEFKPTLPNQCQPTGLFISLNLLDWLQVIKPENCESNRGVKEENNIRKRTCEKRTAGQLHRDSRKMVGCFKDRMLENLSLFLLFLHFIFLFACRQYVLTLPRFFGQTLLKSLWL